MFSSSDDDASLTLKTYKKKTNLTQMDQNRKDLNHLDQNQTDLNQTESNQQQIWITLTLEYFG
jgi:hypothetical protein